MNVQNRNDAPLIGNAVGSVPQHAAITEQLITGALVKDIVVYDISVYELYGRKHCLQLKGNVADRASAAGLDPCVFQAVLWWSLFGLPVFPLGVYMVMPNRDCDDPFNDALQYRGVRVEWDWQQVFVHYTISLLVTVTIAAIVGYWLSVR